MEHVAPLRALLARAEARAILYACGEIDLEEATEPLYLYAIRHGLTDVVTDILRAEGLLE